jgi:hypothetical protein
MSTTQHHLQMQEQEYAKLFNQLVDIRARYSKAILLLTEFIEHFVEQDPTILQRQNDIYLDIDQIKEAEEMQDVEPESLVALGLVLLK